MLIIPKYVTWCSGALAEGEQTDQHPSRDWALQAVEAHVCHCASPNNFS